MDPTVLRPLASLLAQLHSLTLSQLLYSCGDTVYIYQAQSPAFASAAVKIQRVFNASQRAAMLAEGENLKRFKGHPNIVEFQAWLEYEAEGCDFIVIIAEMCDKDLMTDIHQRRSAGRYCYSETQMWEFVTMLVNVLALLESNDIAHRDIKPQNIFLCGDTLKIGDFGSSALIGSGVSSYTTAGTPLFLSPLLKEALLAGNPRVQHNVYKSDVYSLGMTLLAMAALEEPPGGFLGPAAETAIESKIAVLPYSICFKSLLRLLLQADESRRPTFQGLYYLLFPMPDNPVDEEKKPEEDGYSQPLQTDSLLTQQFPAEELSPDGAKGTEELDFELEDRERNAEIEREVREERTFRAVEAQERTFKALETQERCPVSEADTNSKGKGQKLTCCTVF